MSNLLESTPKMPRGRPTREAVHARLAFMVQELKTRLGGLPSPDEAEGIWTDIWYHEAHSSTALEGNTLVLREVEALLREGKAVGSKELKDYLEVSGYAAAAQWVYSQALSSGPCLGGRSAPRRLRTGKSGQLAPARHPRLQVRDEATEPP